MHEVGEAYAKRGETPNDEPYVFVDEDGQTQTWLSPKKAFLPALAFLPRPKLGKAEGKFHVKIDGVAYLGFIDLVCHADDIGLDHGCPVVIDYKTKDTLEARGMHEGPGTFLSDPQAVLYAYKTMRSTGFDRVFLRWIYIKRKGRPGAKAVDALLTLAEVEEAFLTVVHKPAGQMVQLRAKKKLVDPLSVPYNADTCMAYGPKWACKRVSQCKLTSRQKLEGRGGNMDDLLAELEAMDKAPAKPSKAAVAAEAPKGVNPEPLKAEVVKSSGAPSDAEIGRVVRFLLGK